MSVDLDEAAWYIAFEMFHLRYYAEVYESCPPKRRFRTVLGERIGTAYEYSFLLHLRVLLDFFFKEPTSKSKDDVWVGYFRALPNFDVIYEQKLYAAPAEALKISRHLNKRLAHFTEVRWKEKHQHLGMESYRSYWLALLSRIDTFEAALSGTPKAKFDQRMKAFRDSCDHEAYLRPVRP